MNLLETAISVLNQEANALKNAAHALDENLLDRTKELFDFLNKMNGKLIFCGVGKSGNVCQKLASTFSSLGLPSLFLHPIDALHGDMGLIQKNDAIVFISKSGSTEEIQKFLNYLEHPTNLLVGLLGNTSSPIANKCSLVFDCSVESEACKNNQAPTTSTTVAMAVGDALAVVYEHITDLSEEGFATNHPSGFLGKSLRLKVANLMIPKSECPVLTEDKNLEDAILALTNKPVGLCAVIGSSDELIGVVAEGDVRRSFAKNPESALKTPIKEVMSKNPSVVEATERAYKALEMMETQGKQVYQVPVLENGKFVGVIRMHDLMREF